MGNGLIEALQPLIAWSRGRTDILPGSSPT